MTEVLSQDEIDQLLTAISAGDTEGEDTKQITDRKNIKVYDFKYPSILSKHTMKRVSKLFNRVVTAVDREIPQDITLISIDELTFEAVIRSAPPSTKWFLSQQSSTDLDIIYEAHTSCIQKMIPIFSDKFQSILFMDDLTTAKDITSNIKTLLSDQLHDMYIVLTIDYSSKQRLKKDSEGIFTIAFPAKTVWSILGDKMEQINAKFDMDSIETKIQVSLGETKASVGDLNMLGAGSVITLDRKVGDAVPVYVDGKLYGRGEVVLIDDDFGVRLLEVYI